jgi:hypothetical protein
MYKNKGNQSADKHLYRRYFQMNRPSPVLSAQGIKKWIMNFEETFPALKCSQAKKG